MPKQYCKQIPIILSNIWISFYYSLIIFIAPMYANSGFQENLLRNMQQFIVGKIPFMLLCTKFFRFWKCNLKTSKICVFYVLFCISLLIFVVPYQKTPLYANFSSRKMDTSQNIRRKISRIFLYIFCGFICERITAAKSNELFRFNATDGLKFVSLCGFSFLACGCVM